MKLIKVICLLATILFRLTNSHLLAQTSGPTQTEYQSIGGKSLNEMVDPFTGNFNYNIPLFELPGPKNSHSN